jgi:hypothetical protein
VKTAAQYIADAKIKLGDPRMSDRELGERLATYHEGGFIQSNISRAKTGVMTDTLAVALAKVLDEEPGLLLWVARMERERDPKVRAYLERWSRLVGKALARVLALAVLALGLLMQPPEAQAAGIGGDGR